MKYFLTKVCFAYLGQKAEKQWGRLVRMYFQQHLLSSRWTVFYLLEMYSASNNKRCHGSSIRQDSHIFILQFLPSLVFLVIVLFFTVLRQLHHKHQYHSQGRKESSQGKTILLFSDFVTQWEDWTTSEMHAHVSVIAYHTPAEIGLGSSTFELLICVTQRKKM